MDPTNQDLRIQPTFMNQPGFSCFKSAKACQPSVYEVTKPTERKPVVVLLKECLGRKKSKIRLSGWWFQFFKYFQPYLGKWSNLTNIFQLGWNHQLVVIYITLKVLELIKLKLARSRWWQLKDFWNFLPKKNWEKMIQFWSHQAQAWMAWWWFLPMTFWGLCVGCRSLPRALLNGLMALEWFPRCGEWTPLGSFFAMVWYGGWSWQTLKQKREKP